MTYERLTFFTRDQGATESVDQYVKIAVNCDWDSFTPEQLLRDHLVTGIQETKFGQVCPQLKVSSEDYKITSNTVVFL